MFFSFLPPVRARSFLLVVRINPPRKADSFIGVLGQGKIVSSTATNVTQVTKQLMAEFCTPNFGCPYNPSSIASLDEDLLEHIRDHVHSVTVDSAENEIASCHNMVSADSCTAMQGVAFCPNIRTVIRDKAHASRRILQRPWACDAYLDMVAGVLVAETNSIAQMVQASEDNRAFFEDCCRNATRRGTTADFKTLRAAKHRFESLAAPLSRLCLHWEATISFLVKLSGERQSAPAIALLETIDPEMLLQAGLLADATDESMALIRFFDAGEVDSAKIATSIGMFLQRLDFLFDKHLG